MLLFKPTAWYFSRLMSFIREIHDQNWNNLTLLFDAIFHRLSWRGGCCSQGGYFINVSKLLIRWFFSNNLIDFCKTYCSLIFTIPFCIFSIWNHRPDIDDLYQIRHKVLYLQNFHLQSCNQLSFSNFFGRALMRSLS